MRPALKCALVLACLMTVSHQATYQPQSPWQQFPHPYFLGMSSGYQQLQRAAYLKGFYDAGRYLGIGPSLQQNKDIVLHAGQFGDAQARFRSPFGQQSSIVDNETGVEQLGRFFNGGINANYLWKTIFTFSTSTITLCFLSSCIPASQFSAGASNSICRKRRKVLHYLGSLDGGDDSVDDIEPTNVEKVEPTPFAVLEDSNFQPIPQGREITINKVPVLDSSIDAGPQSALLQTPNARDKRFLYLLTTTLTSFQVISTTITSTILPGTTTSALTCRPSGIAVC